MCDSSSFMPKDRLTNSLEMRTNSSVFDFQAVNPLWKVPFTPGVRSRSDLLSHIKNRSILLLNINQNYRYVN